MKKALLVYAVTLALAAPVFAGTNLLVNGDFEDGLNGWYVRDGIGDLPQSTPILPLSEHPNQTWLGSDQPWPQVVDSATNKMDICEGYFDGTTRRFQDSGNDLSTPAPYGSKALGWNRTGLRGWDGIDSMQARDWDGFTWVSQYIKLDPGTYTATASAKVVADGPGISNSSNETRKNFAVTIQILGDDPSYQNWWYVDWYGDEEDFGYPRARANAYPGNSDGNWITTPDIDTKSIKTHTGWIEFRVGFHETEVGPSCNNPNNITDHTTCNWAMVDDVYLDLTLVPEPSSVVPLLAGFVGLGGLALRRRR